jgi:hypothetical protein
MRRLLRSLWIILALLFLAEAWLWDHLQPVVARVVDLIPWGRLKQWIRQLIADLPPWATLIVFIIPIISVLLPLKFLEVYFLTQGDWLGVAAILILAKLLGLGVTAFVFDVTRKKLLQMAWFRRIYVWFIWLRQWAHAQTEPVRKRMRQFARLIKAQRVGRFLRRLMYLRRRAYRSRPA